MQVCSDCATPATFVHREYATVNYACDRHRCYHCTPIKNDDGSGSENIVRACAWDSPTAFRYCYTHQSWVHKPVKLCPVAIEITELRELVGRVQEAIERHNRIYGTLHSEGIPVQVLLRALGGDNNE
jgi:hypothetical protein